MENIAPALLDWFYKNRRILPFREDPTPYHVWLSEVMLQQTRVSAALPYYERFLAVLPDIPALAVCDEEKLHKLWEGLGYYSRVRNLQKAAKIVCEQYGGQLPADYAALRALPGIGDYTAGAIASISFGIPVPAVDGNVMRVLARLTATPLLGVLTGLAVTAVLQSSSAATVMVIGFVSAGLLELPRAVAVIYGINIGTTMTAQLIAFDVQTLVYPVLFLGFLLDFAARRPRWQAVGEAVFSFGLLFEGIDILGRALQPLAGQAVFLDWMTRVKESPLLGILLGLSMTMVVQSSSATIALLQNVARQAGPDGIHSVLGLAGAVPVLLGDNIGTTVTALLACIGQGKDAARAALAHSCFNLSGSLLAAVLLPWFVRLVELISPKGPELEVISRQIANAHTAFNVCCALLWLPFLPWMVRLVCALVPEDR